MATIYIAGPMSGKPDHNAPAFDAEAERLRALGHAALNPADKMRDQLATAAEAGPNWRGNERYKTLLLEDLTWIATRVDWIQLLPGWQYSKGACAEVAMAVAMGIPVFLPGAAKPHDGITVTLTC